MSSICSKILSCLSIKKYIFPFLVISLHYESLLIIITPKFLVNTFMNCSRGGYINIQISFEKRTHCQLQFNLSFKHSYFKASHSIFYVIVWSLLPKHSSVNRLSAFLRSIGKTHSQIAISLSQMLL